MADQLDRNNTNFPLQLVEYLKTVSWDERFNFLKYYQNVFRIYINKVRVGRGLLACIEMGMGKTMIAIATAIDNMDKYQPIILLAKSLEENMRNTVHKYVALRREFDPDFYLCKMTQTDLSEWIVRNFSFVSMNASNMTDQLRRAAGGRAAEEAERLLDGKLGRVAGLPSLEKKLIIVDEAHNLFRAIVNGSKNALSFYESVKAARDIKLLFLTGTPIANDPFELVPCFNMLSGEELLPEYYKDFYKLFVDEAAGTIRNRDKFQNRLFGLLSYVNHKSRPGASVGARTGRQVEFPERLPLTVERVHMDPYQYVTYQLARDKEKEEGKGGFSGNVSAMVKPKSSFTSTYRVKSRQLSNFCPPATHRDVKDPAAIPEESLGSAKYRRMLSNIERHPGQLGIVYSQFTGVGGLGTFARFLESRGWQRVHSERPVKTSAAMPTVAEALADTPTDPAGVDIRDDMVTSDALAPPESPPESETELDEGALARGGWPRHGGPEHDTSDSDIVEMRRERGEDHERDIGPKRDVYTVYRRDNGDVDIFDDKYKPVARARVKCYIELLEDSLDPEFVRRFLDTDATSLRNGGAELRLGGAPAAPKLRFAVIDGSVDVDERDRLKNMFNDPDNAHGEMLALLLISATGAEGLDLKNVRHVHAMEIHWTWGRIEQVIARGARNDSHKDLPPEERNVKPYLYIAVPPEAEMRGDYESTTDMELLAMAQRDHSVNQSFVDALKEVSIECLLNEEANCRRCNPTGEALYTSDIERDIRTRNPCVEFHDETVTAIPITIAGKKYFYAPDDTSIYDYRLYRYMPELDSYQVVPESDVAYAGLADALERGDTGDDTTGDATTGDATTGDATASSDIVGTPTGESTAPLRRKK